jgi:hypothetical protein
MCPSRTPLLIVPLVVLCLCHGASGFYNVTLSNAEMTDYSSGVAVDWNSFTTGAPLPPQLQFFADTGNYRSSPYAQGISGIDYPMSPGSQFGAGLYRQVAVTPGDVYMFVGYQDLYDSYFEPPPARRYAHFFGIAAQGQIDLPVPFNMGPVRWMGADQWFYGEMPGNSTQVGGMHRCVAAWPAESAQMSIWSGVFVYGDAPTSAHPTVFDMDAHALYGFSNAPQASLQNAGFETVENLTPGLASDDIHRITLPAYWVPIGGGIGQKESYYTDATSRRSDAAGLRIYNQRGCLTRGVMQRVQVPPNAISATFSCWIRANRSSGTIARVGIDPTGGSDINSGAINWAYYNRTDEAWEQEAVTVAPSGEVITLFVSMYNYAGSTGTVHYADFDDTALAFTQDETPPEAFTVSAQSPWPLATYLGAEISPAPTDAESGISSVEYAIGTVPGAEDVRPYTACPDPTTVSAYGLNLLSGATYYVTVKATNGAGLATTVASNPVLCILEQCVGSSGEVTVTGTFKYEVNSGTATVWKSVPFCTVQESSGLNALRVITGDAQDSPVPPPAVEPGDIVSVVGTCTTIDGQKTVGWVTPDGAAVDVSVGYVGESANPIRPFVLSVRDLGGGPAGMTNGVTGGLGPNNVGMLVTVVGRVRAMGSDERGVKILYVDDGSAVPCGLSTGCKVYAAGSDAQVGDFVIVTGACSIESYDPTPGIPGDEVYVRVVIPRDVRRVE